jgi:hypothetical protein
MRTAWEAFEKMRLNVGRGRHSQKPLRAISYSQLCYFFPGRSFAALQGQLKAIAMAQIEIGKLRLQFIAEIRRRLPDRPSRPRKRPDWQI